MPPIDKTIVSRNFDRFAKTYADNARLQLRVAQELISQAGRLGGNVLDIGAGPGIIRKLSGWNITALDISPEMVALNDAPAVTADMHQLPFRDGSFNNAIASLSLQWSDDIEKVLAEVHRVLENNGRFAFSIFGPDSLKELRSAFAYIDGDEHLMKFEHAIKIFAMLKKAGFENIVMNSQKISYLYPNILEALRSMKNIGASYVYANNKGLRGRKYFTQVENAYKAITQMEEGVPLHWEVLYIRGDKA